jgi:hypothetical protein
MFPAVFRAFIGFMKAITSCWRSLLSFLPSFGGDREQPLQLSEEQIASLMKLNEETRQKRIAHEKAIAGEGPQPWDQDWPESNEDLSLDVLRLAKKAGWHRVQSLRDALDWCMSSPQFQQALASVQDGPEQAMDSPWLEPLQAFGVLYVSVAEASHQLLREQAQGLNYSDRARSELEDRLRQLKGDAAAF